MAVLNCKMSGADPAITESGGIAARGSCDGFIRCGDAAAGDQGGQAKGICTRAPESTSPDKRAAAPERDAAEQRRREAEEKAGQERQEAARQQEQQRFAAVRHEAELVRLVPERRETAQLLSRILASDEFNRFYLRADGSIFEKEPRGEPHPVAKAENTVAVLKGRETIGTFGKSVFLLGLRADGTLQLLYREHKRRLFEKSDMSAALKESAGWSGIVRMGFDAACGQIAGLTRDGKLLRTKTPKSSGKYSDAPHVLLFDEHCPEAYLERSGSPEDEDSCDEDVFSQDGLVQYLNLESGLYNTDRAALKADGTVVFSSRKPAAGVSRRRIAAWEQYRTAVRRTLDGWRNVVQLAFYCGGLPEGCGVLLGLCSDGTVLSCVTKQIREADFSDKELPPAAYSAACTALLDKAAKARNVLALVAADLYFLTADEPQFTQQFGCSPDAYVRILKQRITRSGLQQ